MFRWAVLFWRFCVNLSETTLLNDATVVRRGESIVLGTFPHCWNGRHTRQLCCTKGEAPPPSCFNFFWTKERCCTTNADVSGETSQTRNFACLQGIRHSLRRCLDTICDAEGQDACSETVETSFCKEHCGNVLPESKTSGISRSNRLGRVLWCLAQQPTIHSVLDLFLGRGDGSAALLVDSILHHQSSGRPSWKGWGLLAGFERWPQNFEAAKEWLKTQSKVKVIPWLLPNPVNFTAMVRFIRTITHAQFRAIYAQDVRAVVIRGEPFSEKLENPAAVLFAFCNYVKVDLVFIDPSQTTAHKEWAIIENACKPLRWVVVNNMNLPSHAGWLRERLLTLPKWVEIFAGQTVDNSPSNLSPLLQDQFRLRVWSVFLNQDSVCKSWRDSDVESLR